MHSFSTALHAIVRRPASSLILVFTIGLGIGASTAIFTVVDAVLLRPIPFRAPSRLANVWALEKNGFAHPGVEREVADFWRGRSDLFSEVASYVERSVLYRSADEPLEVRATFVSPEFFHLLGVRPAVGRTILADDAVATAPNVVVVSYALWRNRLGGRIDAIGRAMTLDGVSYIVIGVMPEWFRFPLGNASAWSPLKPGTLRENERRTTNLVARIRDDLAPATAQRRARQLATQLDATAKRPNGWGISLFFLDHNDVDADVRTTLWVLAGAVLCLLLIACANAANILLVRATARHRELAIRSALGATRSTLVTQLLLESLCLALLGGALGVAIAYWGVDLLLLILPTEMSFLTYTPIGVDARVLAFAALASIATGVIFGVGPALRASRAHGTFLVQDRSTTSTKGTSRVRGALIAAEVALSLALLAGVGVFAHSFINLNGVRPGFDAPHVATAELSISPLRYPGPEAREAIIAAYRDRLRSVPGVTGVSVSTGAPPRTGVTLADRLEAEGSAPLSTEMLVIPFTEGDTAYFATLGIHLTSGRGFRDDDRRASDRRAVIDQDLAHALWPSTDPIGRRFRTGPEDAWVTVIGVAERVKLLGPNNAAGKYGVYYPLPISPRPTRFVQIVVRTSGDPRQVIDPIKRAIWAVDPQQPINQVETARDQIADALAKPRFLLALMGVFAAVALGLAVIGLYGVLSHAVSLRTREIGIRMALGAQAAEVLRSVLFYGGVLTALGIAGGLGLAAVTGGLVRSLLFGVAPLDPAAVAGAAVTLAAAALAACYFPARRATKVDPLIALRSE